ncbi:MAG: hypothetical protein JRH13_02655 [Deltaproteobacteria bacterium]|nr:hypothetical protein [Deltaproteobacteria bacterium]MBW2128247.1 hypothetical protein [Deltaproteobacteria bacterium]
MEKILIEVVAPMLSSIELSHTGSELVFSCLGLKGKDRKACTEAYPDDWKEAVGYLSRWIKEIARLYRHRIRVRIIDAQSPLGLWKQLRHRVFKFPAFIVDKKHTYIGWNYSELETIIDNRIENSR